MFWGEKSNLLQKFALLVSSGDLWPPLLTNLILMFKHPINCQLLQQNYAVTYVGYYDLCQVKTCMTWENKEDFCAA